MSIASMKAFSLRISSLSLSTSSFQSSFIAAFLIVFLVGVIFPRTLAFAPLILSILGVLGFRVAFGDWPRLSKKFFFCSAVVFGLVACSSLWSINPAISSERALKVGVILFSGGLLFSLSGEVSKQSAAIISKLFPYILSFGSAYMLYQILTYGELYYAIVMPGLQVEDRFMENFSKFNRSIIILFLGFLIAFQAFRVQARQSIQAHLWRFITFLSILILAIFYFTHSQSAQLALLLGLFFCFLFPYRMRAAWIGFGGLALFCILGAPWIAQIAFQTIPPMFEHIYWLTSGPSAFARMEIWDFIARKALESPLWGHGVEATRVIQDFATQERYHRAPGVLHPHNIALQFWIEFGALGAVLLSAFCAWLLRAIFMQGVTAAKIYLPLFVAIAVVSAFGYGFWQSWWIGCMIFMVCLARLSITALEQQDE